MRLFAVFVCLVYLPALAFAETRFWYSADCQERFSGSLISVRPESVLIQQQYGKEVSVVRTKFAYGDRIFFDALQDLRSACNLLENSAWRADVELAQVSRLLKVRRVSDHAILAPALSMESESSDA